MRTHDEILSDLHAHFRHPGFEYETTEGQRKAFDDDRTPEGDGWERNLDAGRPGEGWDRFEYTEEAYWRRPRRDRSDDEIQGHLLARTWHRREVGEGVDSAAVAVHPAGRVGLTLETPYCTVRHPLSGGEAAQLGADLLAARGQLEDGLPDDVPATTEIGPGRNYGQGVTFTPTSGRPIGIAGVGNRSLADARLLLRALARAVRDAEVEP